MEREEASNFAYARCRDGSTKREDEVGAARPTGGRRGRRQRGKKGGRSADRRRESPSQRGRKDNVIRRKADTVPFFDGDKSRNCHRNTTKHPVEILLQAFQGYETNICFSVCDFSPTFLPRRAWTLPRTLTLA